MRKKPNQSWHFYQFDPTQFKLDPRIRKLDGPDIAILRVIHDAMWMTGEQRLLDDINTLATEIDIPATLLEAPLERLIHSKALYSIGGFLMSPHIDDCWRDCQHRSEMARQKVAKRYNK